MPETKTEPEEVAGWKVLVMRGFIQWPIVVLLGGYIWLTSQTNLDMIKHSHEIELRQMDDALKMESQKIEAMNHMAASMEESAENTAAFQTAIELHKVTTTAHHNEFLREMKEQDESRERRAESYDKLALVLDRLTELLKRLPDCVEPMEMIECH